jgi:hypothetical protein
MTYGFHIQPITSSWMVEFVGSLVGKRLQIGEEFGCKIWLKLDLMCEWHLEYDMCIYGWHVP